MDACFEDAHRESSGQEGVPDGRTSSRPDWVPPFPGILDAPSCRAWKPGVAMDMTKFRKKDDVLGRPIAPRPSSPLNETGQNSGHRFGD